MFSQVEDVVNKFKHLKNLEKNGWEVTKPSEIPQEKVSGPVFYVAIKNDFCTVVYIVIYLLIISFFLYTLLLLLLFI